jgi:hypothetical protein
VETEASCPEETGQLSGRGKLSLTDRPAGVKREELELSCLEMTAELKKWPSCCEEKGELLLKDRPAVVKREDSHVVRDVSCRGERGCSCHNKGVGVAVMK